VQPLTTGLGIIDVDAPAIVQRQHAQVINAMRMVGMLMGKEHGVDPIDIGVEQLLAHIRSGVDQDSRWLFNAFRPTFNQQRTAPAAISRFLRIAGAPVIADARHATGRAAAENGRYDPVRRRHAYLMPDLAKRRPKLAVVSAPTCSRLTPR